MQTEKHTHVCHYGIKIIYKRIQERNVKWNKYNYFHIDMIDIDIDMNHMMPCEDDMIKGINPPRWHYACLYYL